MEPEGGMDEDDKLVVAVALRAVGGDEWLKVNWGSLSEPRGFTRAALGPLENPCEVVEWLLSVLKRWALVVLRDFWAGP